MRRLRVWFPVWIIWKELFWILNEILKVIFIDLVFIAQVWLFGTFLLLFLWYIAKKSEALSLHPSPETVNNSQMRWHHPSKPKQNMLTFTAAEIAMVAVTYRDTMWLVPHVVGSAASSNKVPLAHDPNGGPNWLFKWSAPLTNMCVWVLCTKGW